MSGMPWHAMEGYGRVWHGCLCSAAGLKKELRTKTAEASADPAGTPKRDVLHGPVSAGGAAALWEMS